MIHLFIIFYDAGRLFKSRVNFGLKNDRDKILEIQCRTDSAHNCAIYLPWESFSKSKITWMRSVTHETRSACLIPTRYLKGNHFSFFILKSFETHGLLKYIKHNISKEGCFDTGIRMFKIL